MNLVDIEGLRVVEALPAECVNSMSKSDIKCFSYGKLARAIPHFSDLRLYVSPLLHL